MTVHFAVDKIRKKSLKVRLEVDHLNDQDRLSALAQFLTCISHCPFDSVRISPTPSDPIIRPEPARVVEYLVPMWACVDSALCITAFEEASVLVNITFWHDANATVPVYSNHASLLRQLLPKVMKIPGRDTDDIEKNKPNEPS